MPTSPTPALAKSRLRAAQARQLAESGLRTTPGRWVVDRFDWIGGPTFPLETAAFLDSFLPSLMPRASIHQGLAAGINVLTARAAGATVEAANTLALAPDAGFGPRVAVRGVEAAIGHALASLPEYDDETLWRSGARTGGDVLRAASIGGLVYDGVNRARMATGQSQLRVVAANAAVPHGASSLASRRLAVLKREIRRWPVAQEATVPAAYGMAAGVMVAGTGVGRLYRLSGSALSRYFGPGLSKSVLARTTNAGLWAAGVTALYNGFIGYLGRANEKMEPAYAQIPGSELVSGSSESLSPYAELGQQGRRYVTDVVPPELIEEVLGEPAVAHPVRTYVGFNTAPLYSSGRAELALDELERTGAFDRSYLLLVSPTGTGWVDQAVVEAAEFLTRGDIATCAIQYGRFPSFLCIQKVGLGRIQFRLLLWGIKQRLAERPAERRPKVLVFGESLGAWTASDVVMDQGITGFDHYGIDRALWMGLPALAKWSRNGMATGSSHLVPDGTVGVFDRHEQLAELDDDARERLRAVILSHDNDPVASVRPELAIQQPAWLREERGRNVSSEMDWIPVVTFWQVAIDAANAMVTVPGEFRSFGHDYRADTTRFVRDAFHLPSTDEAQTRRIDDALKAIDVDRKARIKATRPDEAPLPPAAQYPESEFHGGIPLLTARAAGPRWFRTRPERPSEGAA
ncbi:MAG: alpha/beta-hydrolase family protein [Acidimicrobiales bacterium]